MGALSGDYVISNPGFETVMPIWTRFDSNNDGTPDSVKFHFDIYKVGTLTKLFSTPDKTINLSICTSGIMNEDKNIDFKRISNVLVLSVKEYVLCATSSKEVNAGYVYAVNLSAANKTPWFKTFSQELNGTGILPDMNNNGTGELLVVTTKSKSVIQGQFDGKDVTATTYIYDGETGISLATPKSYIVDR
ncbi:MAG: hypothetical protein CTY16_18910 [Methylobacter sp.]|nr:MAG: hypothetical protein CTY16_18910 [Methylobacter sp.]